MLNRQVFGIHLLQKGIVLFLQLFKHENLVTIFLGHRANFLLLLIQRGPQLITAFNVSRGEIQPILLVLQVHGSV